MLQSNLIGKVLHVNEDVVRVSDRYLRSDIIPKVRNVIKEYIALESLPPFTAEIWAKIIQDGGQSVCEAFRRQAESDIRGFKNPIAKKSIMQNVEEALQPFRNAVRAAIDSQDSYGSMPTVALYLTDVMISDSGEPVPDLSRVKDEARLIIETETQARLYSAGKNAEAALNELRVLLVGTSINPDRIGWGGTKMTSTIFRLVGEGASAKIEFVPSAIKFVKE